MTNRFWRGKIRDHIVYLQGHQMRIKPGEMVAVLAALCTVVSFGYGAWKELRGDIQFGSWLLLLSYPVMLGAIVYIARPYFIAGCRFRSVLRKTADLRQALTAARVTEVFGRQAVSDAERELFKSISEFNTAVKVLMQEQNEVVELIKGFEAMAERMKAPLRMRDSLPQFFAPISRLKKLTESDQLAGESMRDKAEDTDFWTQMPEVLMDLETAFRAATRTGVTVCLKVISPQNNNELVSIFSTRADCNRRGVDSTLPLAGSIWGRVFQSGRPIAFQTLNDESVVHFLPETWKEHRAHVGSGIVHPVLNDGAVVAVLNVDCKAENAIQDSFHPLVSLAADVIATMHQLAKFVSILTPDEAQSIADGTRSARRRK